MKVCFLFFFPFLASIASAQLVSYDGFEDYAAGLQFESGANGSSGTGLDGGFGWDGAYNVNNAIKSLVKAEDRTASRVIYSNGDIFIDGGIRAMRLSDNANGSATLVRKLGTTFSASDVLFFSFMFRTNAGSPLPNQDFFQLGFDDGSVTLPTNPRLSIGANTTNSTFPPNSPFQFFARTTTTTTNSAFDSSNDIAAAMTYFLVGKITGTGGVFDRVDLFVNPSTTDEPVPSASFVLNSGATTVDTLTMRTANLDASDVYVFDEMRVSRDWVNVIPEPSSSLLIAAGASLFIARRRRG